MHAIIGIALIVIAAALILAAIYNHKSIAADVAKADAVAAKLDATVAPAVQAAKPAVAQAAAEVQTITAGAFVDPTKAQ